MGFRELLGKNPHKVLIKSPKIMYDRAESLQKKAYSALTSLLSETNTSTELAIKYDLVEENV